MIVIIYKDITGKNVQDIQSFVELKYIYLKRKKEEKQRLTL